MFGGVGAIAKSLQSMVYADSVEELTRHVQGVMDKLEAIRSISSRNASLTQVELKKLVQALNEISDHSFVTLPVYTGGTLSNSYAESINSCLRKKGLNPFKSRFESMFALRRYCSAYVLSKKGHSDGRIQQLNERMQEDVVKIVSDGVLRQQAQMIKHTTEKLAANKCSIHRENEAGTEFVVVDTVERS